MNGRQLPGGYSYWQWDCSRSATKTGSRVLSGVGLWMRRPSMLSQCALPSDRMDGTCQSYAIIHQGPRKSNTDRLMRLLHREMYITCRAHGRPVAATHHVDLRSPPRTTRTLLYIDRYRQRHPQRYLPALSREESRTRGPSGYSRVEYPWAVLDLSSRVRRSVSLHD